MKYAANDLILALLIAMPAVAAIEPVTPGLEISTDSGCKLANPFHGNSEPAEVSWTGKCKDGYLEGFGTVTKVRSGESLRGEFLAGRARHGIVTDRRGTYEGELEDNIPDGKGVFTGTDGFVLKSFFTKRQSFGKVAVAWRDGSRYEGEFDHQNERMEGRGKLMAVDGTTYEGGFRANLFDGEGTLRLTNGEVRTGTFARGKVNGEVAISLPNGAKYRGQAVDDKPSGYGVMEYATGGRYEGAFLEGMFHGPGVMRQSDGSVTEATFLAGLPHGHGKQKYPNGDSYAGEFVDGKRHGTGRLTTWDGNVLEGEWNGGTLHGKCTVTDSNGSYRGTCVAGKRSGIGRSEIPSAEEIYEGEFFDDLPNGKGRLQRKDYVCEGTFKAGRLHGPGRETYPGGEFEGEFRDGARHGQGRLQVGSKDVNLLYEGMFAAGQFEGAGRLRIGSMQMQGEFKRGRLSRGIVSSGNRKIELDVEKEEFMELLPDGSKRRLDEPKLPESNVGT